MCTTCGCSSNDEPSVTDLDAVAAGAFPKGPDHVAEHHHSDGHAHESAHGPHGDDHQHGHDAHSHHHESAAPPTPRLLQLEQDVLAKNNQLAARNRGWLEGRAIVAWNLMSAPGAGKTSLLERTIRDVGRELGLSVIEGDQETARDAERIRAAGGRVVQINTGNGCHLDAEMVARALRTLEPPLRSLVVIENVGNLVCPALFDLGEQTKAVMMSVTEGDDKPLKYPHMFRASDVLILNKIDLLPYVPFDVDRCLEHARRVNPRLRMLAISVTRGDGLDAWYALLRQEVSAHAGSH